MWDGVSAFDPTRILEAFPSLKYAFAVGIVIVTLWQMRKAERQRQAMTAPRFDLNTPEGSQLFFDGPVNEALRSLRSIDKRMGEFERREEIRSEVAKIEKQAVEERWREHLRLLRSIDGHFRNGRRDSRR